MNWYKDSYDAIKFRYGDDADLYCKLLAATSPMSELKSNITLANKAYVQVKAGLPVTGFIGNHKVNIERVRNGLPLSGQKISQFYLNLIGEQDAITIDRWVMRAFNMGHDIPTQKEYESISKQIRERAQVDGITASEYQARIWMKVRGKSDTFANHLQGKQLEMNLEEI